MLARIRLHVLHMLIWVDTLRRGHTVGFLVGRLICHKRKPHRRSVYLNGLICYKRNIMGEVVSDALLQKLLFLRCAIARGNTVSQTGFCLFVCMSVTNRVRSGTFEPLEGF